MIGEAVREGARLGLPPFHVPRPRLTERCRDEKVVVVEASAGYGKSVFAAELVDAWGVVPIAVLLEEGSVSAQLLASRLRAAVAQAGFTDAAVAMASAADDPPGVVDAMLVALRGERCAFVIDDAHNAMRDAGLIVDRIAARLEGGQRLVVLARQLPPGAERLRRADALHLGASDLAVSPGETLELCRSGFSLQVTVEDGRLLDAATGGWTAAVVLAASRAKRTGQSLHDVAQHESGSDAVASILDELMVALGAGTSALARIAPLPILDRELLGMVTGDDTFFDRAVALGLPLSSAGGRWSQLPGPVRDHLRTLGPPDTASLVQAASYYEQRGELGAALQMLLAAGEAEEAARCLAQADPRRLEALDALELLAVMGRIPEPVLDAYPRGVFQIARACGVASFLQTRAQLLHRLSEQVTPEEDPVLRRAIDAELATDLINGDRPTDALPVARRLLSEATVDEQLTRARALTVLGQATCFRRDDDGSLSEDTLREAAGYLDQSIEIYLGMGYGEATSGAAVERAIRTEMGTGHAAAALDVLDAALLHVSRSPRRLGRLLFYRAQVLTELGRHDESEATLADVMRIAGGDSIMDALVHWERMILASYRGDATAALEQADLVEANRADWWAAAGTDFLAEAADCLDRVGHIALASERLRRAQEDPQGYDWMIAMAECALLARHGDPVLAEERLAEVLTHGIYPRERWRVTLLRAYAAWRRGDRIAGALAAKAFEETARLGQPDLPRIREREITETLVGLAVDTGSPAAAALEASSLPMVLGVLGRFELTLGGRPVSLGPGQATQLLKLVAVNGGRVPSERAIEALWPESDPSAGRNRLRTVLGRLRDAAPDVIRRDGDLLVLGADVRVDLDQFTHDARQARMLAGGDPESALAVARSAIARYRGELLPDDPYEAWADEPRDASRRAMLDLLDLCASEAARRGDLDEARRMVERSLELAPFEDERYRRIAKILHDQGREGAALSVLQRAQSVLAPLGIEVPLDLATLDAVAAA
jgi:DNA-binding SARP family transcriptional activator/ATP/maltotriose-dependent transcriptional regulator MalT